MVEQAQKELNDHIDIALAILQKMRTKPLAKNEKTTLAESISRAKKLRVAIDYFEDNKPAML